MLSEMEVIPVAEGIVVLTAIMGLLLTIIICQPANGLPSSKHIGGDLAGYTRLPTVASVAGFTLASMLVWFLVLLPWAPQAGAQSPQEGFGDRQAATDVYDRAGVLSAAQERDLQGQSASLEQGTAVAIGDAEALEGRLEEASERGEVPAWLSTEMRRRDEAAAGFYPYWGSFHGCCVPPPAAGTGAGGAIGGGAAGGAGGGTGAGGAGGGGGF